jgi:succinate dehydrogenase flavin-adding protein (antitoxin of CptAB toxin-antitoxin module)
MDYTTIFPHFSKLLEENDSDHYRWHHSAPDW